MAGIAPNPPEDDACWVCLSGAGNKRSSLLRDCACHGSGGFAHLKCLTRRAITETQAILKKNEKPCSNTSNRSGTGPRFGERGHNPWSECPLCKYPYEGETLQALACAMQQRYGKDMSASVSSTMENSDGSSFREKDRIIKPLSIFLEKLTLQTMANAKAESSKHPCKKEAIILYQQLLDIERGEQESFADRRCTALEKGVVLQEMTAMCFIGEIYAELGDWANALSILEEALALAKRRECEGAYEAQAHALRIMSEVMLANGNTDDARICIQKAKHIWDSTSKHGSQQNTLEIFKCQWQFGVVLVEVGDRDSGLAALNSTLAKGERELGSTYSLVKSWKQIIEKV